MLRDQAGATYRLHGPLKGPKGAQHLTPAWSHSQAPHCDSTAIRYYGILIHLSKGCAAEAACSEKMPACNAPARPSYQI